MPTQTSTVPAVLDRLKALLDAHKALGGNDLVGVTITTAASGAPDLLESIQFIDVPDDTHAWESQGGRRQRESYIIQGEILIVRRGAGDDIAKAARDRAYDIAGELQTVVWANTTLEEIAVRTDLRYATGGLEQGWQDNGRVAVVRFSVSVTSLLAR